MPIPTDGLGFSPADATHGWLHIERREDPMGLFDWLAPKKKNCKVLGDLVWTSHKHKTLGMVKAIKQSLEQRPTLLVCHFPKTLTETVGVLKIAGIDSVVWESKWCHEVESQLLSSGSSDPARPIVILTRNLIAADPPEELAAAGPVVNILAVERHLLRTEDDLINDFANGLPSKSQLQFSVSLDEPLMKMFAGPWVVEILKTMDFPEDEAVESDMIVRRIRGAQEKIKSRTNSNELADSAEQWSEINSVNLGK